MNEKYIIISSISEFYYCKRRFYLRFIEQQNCENQYITEGIIGHKNTHLSNIEKRKNLIKVSNMDIYSQKNNIIGKCDMVEFTKSPNGVKIDFLDGIYNIYPIEYKHGIVRNEKEYNLQLCAQAICLEEMYNCHIECGDIYYIDSNKRQTIKFDNELRNTLFNTINEIKLLYENFNVPEPIFKKSCNKCSLIDICNPKNTNIEKYINNIWEDI